jgi:hypothetical protein
MNDLLHTPPRWRGTRGGRRSTDLHPGHDICTETRLEVGRLKMVVERLVDALQALTAVQHKPQL